MTPEERHRAPALWVVALAVGTAAGVAVLVDARWAATVLVVTLAGAAVARVTGRGRRPEGIAIRATWVDVLVLVVLAVGIALLSLSPGVTDVPGSADLGEDGEAVGDALGVDDAAGQERSGASGSEPPSSTDLPSST